MSVLEVSFEVQKYFYILGNKKIQTRKLFFWMECFWNAFSRILVVVEKKLRNSLELFFSGKRIEFLKTDTVYSVVLDCPIRHSACYYLGIPLVKTDTGSTVVHFPVLISWFGCTHNHYSMRATTHGVIFPYNFSCPYIQTWLLWDHILHQIAKDGMVPLIGLVCTVGSHRYPSTVMQLVVVAARLTHTSLYIDDGMLKWIWKLWWWWSCSLSLQG